LSRGFPFLGYYTDWGASYKLTGTVEKVSLIIRNLINFNDINQVMNGLNDYEKLWEIVSSPIGSIGDLSFRFYQADQSSTSKSKMTNQI
jgi:hypothetical protein